MPRLITVPLAIALGAFLSVLAIVLVASVTGPRVTSTVTVIGLAAPVEVDITEAGVVRVEAAHLTDLFAGLGYGHALRHAWTMTLMKVAASGRLSQSAPDASALAIDHHIAMLGIPSTSRRAYRAMPDSLRALFDAYVEGVNTSFEQNRLVRGDEFIVLPLEHAAWEPWHPIAVEMMLGYLAAASEIAGGPDPRHAAFPQELRSFLSADSLLRTTLGVGGFEHSVAFVTPDTAGTTFFHRLVYGETGLPLVQPADLSFAGTSISVTSIPGTLALPAGYAADRAWALVPTPNAAFSVAEALPPDPQHGRVVRHDGSEILVTSRRSSGRLFLAETRGMPIPVTVPDEDQPQVDEPDDDGGITEQEGIEDETEEPAAPVAGWWTFDWAGVAGQATDLRAWLALLHGREATLATFNAAILYVTSGGSARVTGPASFSSTIPGGLVVGGSERARDLAERLTAGPPPGTETGEFGRDTYSSWAERLARPLVSAVGRPDSVETDLRDAVAFLDGWDLRYDGDAIAASIFDRWMLAYERTAGHFPVPDTLDLAPFTRTDTLRVPFAQIVADEMAEARRAGRRPPAIVDTLAAHPERADSLVSVARERVQDPPDLRFLKAALREALEELEQLYGPPGPSWRWHRVQGAHLRFPGRTDRPGAAPDARRYRDVQLGDGGHPTAVRWGPSHLYQGVNRPASWSAWVSTSDWDAVRFMLREPFREPLDDRYADPPEPTPIRGWVRGAPVRQTIRLVPPT